MQFDNTALIHSLILLSAIHFIAVSTPGPDFFCVSQTSLRHGRRAGAGVAIGITFGLVIHICLGALGLAVLMQHQSILLAIKIVCGAYLLYLGYQCLRTTPDESLNSEYKVKVETTAAQVRKGFFCNLLNPKAPIYFLSLFTSVISPDIATKDLLIISLVLIAVTLGWFLIVAMIFSNQKVQAEFKKMGVWIDKVAGLVFTGFGLAVLFSAKNEIL